MGIALNRPAQGSVAWFTDIDNNWATLESDFVARQKSDTSIVTVTGTTSETALMANASIPANGLGVGKVVRPWAAGTFTIPASGSPTITWRLRWGGLAGVLLATAQWSFGTTGSAYTLGWVTDFLVTGKTAGASGSAEVDGWHAVGNTFGSISSGAITIDTTAAKVLLWTVQLSITTISVSQRLGVTDRG